MSRTYQTPETVLVIDMNPFITSWTFLKGSTILKMFCPHCGSLGDMRQGGENFKCLNAQCGYQGPLNPNAGSEVVETPCPACTTGHVAMEDCTICGGKGSISEGSEWGAASFPDPVTGTPVDMSRITIPKREDLQNVRAAGAAPLRGTAGTSGASGVLTSSPSCPKCDSNEKPGTEDKGKKEFQAYSTTRQTRSSDEPETKFFTCPECDYTWREYQ